MNKFLNTLYDADESFSDISIQLENGKNIQCHKAILGGQSEFFKKMFLSKMEESKSKVIKLNDDPKYLEEMLKHMYFMKENLNHETAVGLFVIAHKFQYFPLVVECKEIILKNLNKENSATLLQFSKQYEWKELKTNCLNLIISEFENFQNVDDLSLEEISFILKSDKLYIKNEINLFFKIEEWVLCDKEREKKMFQLFDLIDFSIIENILDLANGKLGKSNNSLKSYLFEISQEIKNGNLKPIEHFGPSFSPLLSSKEQHILLNWIGEKRNWTLCYRATTNGFDGYNYRSRCSSYSETITIFKSSSGFIFGGYTPIRWSDFKGIYEVYDKERYSMNYSFLFSIKNPFGTAPQKFPKNSKLPTYELTDFGFDFFVLC
jgi:hypothetical protein